MIRHTYFRVPAFMLCALAVALALAGCDSMPDGTLGTSIALYENYYGRVMMSVDARVSLAPGAEAFVGDRYAWIAASYRAIAPLSYLLQKASENDGHYEAAEDTFGESAINSAVIDIRKGKPETTFSVSYDYDGARYVGEGRYDAKTESVVLHWQIGGVDSVFSYARRKVGGYIGQIVLPKANADADGVTNAVNVMIGFSSEDIILGAGPVDKSYLPQDVYGKREASIEYAASSWFQVRSTQDVRSGRDTVSVKDSLEIMVGGTRRTYEDSRIIVDGWDAEALADFLQPEGFVIYNTIHQSEFPCTVGFTADEEAVCAYAQALEDEGYVLQEDVERKGLDGLVFTVNMDGRQVKLSFKDGSGLIRYSPVYNGMSGAPRDEPDEQVEATPGGK